MCNQTRIFVTKSEVEKQFEGVNASDHTFITLYLESFESRFDDHHILISYINKAWYWFSEGEWPAETDDYNDWDGIVTHPDELFVKWNSK